MNDAETSSTASPSASRRAYSASTASRACADRSGSSSPSHGDPRGEQRVLELVLPLGELAVDDPLLAREPQPRDRLARAVARGVLSASRSACELLAGEEIGVPRDDRRLLRGLLLPHPHRTRLLGALDPVGLEPLSRTPSTPSARHAATSAPRRSRSSATSRPRSSRLS